jgi:hypothetical protein
MYVKHCAQLRFLRVEAFQEEMEEKDGEKSGGPVSQRTG